MFCVSPDVMPHSAEGAPAAEGIPYMFDVKG
jgi:hypothetical protein